MVQGSHCIHPKREGLLQHQPIQGHCSSKCGRENLFLGDGNTHDQLPSSKQLYIDTSCQKAGVPGFPGSVEHSAMIWDQNQTAKRNKSDFHVVWLDLANAYGSVPHQLIRFALNFFHIPPCIQSLITNYFDILQVC